MADFILRSLRGGLNNSDPEISIPDDQCTVAVNVEFHDSLLGERRLGTTGVDIVGSDLVGHDRLSFLYRHLPEDDESAAELWAWAFTTGGTADLCRKTSSWATITVDDALDITGKYPYLVQAQSLHGKLFVAYKSSVDRLHVYDGDGNLRKTGIKAHAAAPTAADTGSGLFTGTRYYRTRSIEKSGSTILRRSEPSAVLEKAPSGSGTGLVVTRPTDVGEGTTHWELEASLNNADFFVIAETAIATTTATDSQAFESGYANDFELSEDVGDYTLLPSARYLCADGDRLLFGGSYEDSDLESQVGWTVVRNAEGVGNDERYEADTDPLVDLDGGDGGGLTGLALAVAGSVYAFKVGRIYKLVRSGERLRAYNTIRLGTDRGALHGSVVVGVDENGRSCVYFLDPAVGPCRITFGGGIEQCGVDIRETWATVNLDATKVVCSAVYYPEKRQVIWNIATDDANVPNLTITLQTNECRRAEAGGVRRGWTTWNGTRASGLAMCMFAENIDDDTDRSRVLRPFIGVEGGALLHRCDTGNTDNGTAYQARIVTKPYAPVNLLHRFGVMCATVVAKAVTGAKITFKMIRDFGLETKTADSDVTFDASAAGETVVIKDRDDMVFSECRAVQLEFVDPASAGTRFELHQVLLKDRNETR